MNHLPGCELRSNFEARNQSESGYAVAEFAVTVSALVLIASLVTSIIGLAATQLRLEAAAGVGARIVGRGDPIPDSFKAGLPENTRIEKIQDGDLVHFQLLSEQHIGFGKLSRSVALRATAVARLEPVFDEFG